MRERCLIAYLVDHAIPGVACVVDDDVNLAVAEVCGLLDERFEVFVVEHVTWCGDCLAARLVDGVGDGLCFFWTISVSRLSIKSYLVIYVASYDIEVRCDMIA